MTDFLIQVLEKYGLQTFLIVTVAGFGVHAVNKTLEHFIRESDRKDQQLKIYMTTFLKAFQDNTKAINSCSGAITDLSKTMSMFAGQITTLEEDQKNFLSIIKDNMNS